MTTDLEEIANLEKLIKKSMDFIDQNNKNLKLIEYDLQVLYLLRQRYSDNIKALKSNIKIISCLEYRELKSSLQNLHNKIEETTMVKESLIKKGLKLKFNCDMYQNSLDSLKTKLLKNKTILLFKERDQNGD